MSSFAQLGYPRLKLDACRVKGVVLSAVVALQFAPMVDVGRRAMIKSEMAIELRQDARQLVFAAHGLFLARASKHERSPYDRADQRECRNGAGHQCKPV